MTGLEILPLAQSPVARGFLGAAAGVALSGRAKQERMLLFNIHIKKGKAIYKQCGLRAKIAPGNAPVAELLANEGFQCNGVIPGVPGSITKTWIGYSWEAT